MKNRGVQIVIIVVGLYIIWSSARSLLDLKKAGGRLEEAKKAFVEAKKESQALKGRLEEVSTREFVEKEAREKLNLQLPGEVVVILPDEKIIDDRSKIIDQTKALANWEKWWKLFFQ